MHHFFPSGIGNNCNEFPLVISESAPEKKKKTKTKAAVLGEETFGIGAVL